MLGVGGRFASAKGMVAVPNISNLSRSQAQAALSAAGLNFLEAGPVDTGNSGLADKVSSQGIPAGQLVDYETSISYSYYRYVAPAPSGPSLVSTERVVSYAGEIINSYCSGTTKVSTDASKYEVSYKYTYSDGSVSIVRAPSEDYTTPGFDRWYTYNSTDCGYVAPAPAVDCTSCVNSFNYNVSDSGCASGLAWWTRCDHPTGCLDDYTDTRGGCQTSGSNIVPDPVQPEPTCGCTAGCTPWYRSSCQGGYRFVTRRCTDCNCGETRETYYESC